MNILMILPTSSGIGCVAQHVLKLVEKLLDKDLQVNVISCNRIKYVKKKGFTNSKFFFVIHGLLHT